MNENRALVDHILVEQTQKVPNISDAEAGFRSIIGTCECVSEWMVGTEPVSRCHLERAKLNGCFDLLPLLAELYRLAILYKYQYSADSEIYSHAICQRQIHSLLTLYYFTCTHVLFELQSRELQSSVSACLCPYAIIFCLLHNNVFKY